MNSQIKSKQSIATAIFFSSILLLGFTYLGTARAAPTQPALEKANPIQLAERRNHRAGHHRGHRGHRDRHRGRHWRGGPGWGIGINVGPRHRYRNYWTGWRPYYRHGRRCERKCLVDRWSGEIIQCQRRCRW